MMIWRPKTWWLNHKTRDHIKDSTEEWALFWSISLRDDLESVLSFEEGPKRVTNSVTDKFRFIFNEKESLYNTSEWKFQLPRGAVQTIISAESAVEF